MELDKGASVCFYMVLGLSFKSEFSGFHGFLMLI